MSVVFCKRKETGRSVQRPVVEEQRSESRQQGLVRRPDSGAGATGRGVKKGNNVFTGNVRGQTGGALGNFQVTLTRALCHVREIGKWPSWVWLNG